jgi:serine/threonine-protein kinase
LGADAEILARAEQRVGTTLCGKYRIERVLGVGGMAVVYVATHRMQKQFALKMLHPELSMRGDIRQRFLREGIAANTVGHAGAVSVIDNDTSEDGAAFLVMELLDGAEVEALWEGFARRMPVPYVLAVAYQLLDVLAAAHARSIIHRDIKPQNLFVTYEGRLKVLDFGIARVRDAAASSGANVTDTGMMLGTPAFMAPEQALAKSSDIDGRTDLWAVGATMFTLLCGEYVHEGDNGAQIVIKAATTPARSLASVWRDVPRPLAELVDRALAFEKEDRWRGAAEMRDAVGATQSAVFGRIMGPEALLKMWRDIEDGLARTQENTAEDPLRKSLAGHLGTKVSPTRTAPIPAPASDEEPTLSIAAKAGARAATRPSEPIQPPRLVLVGGTTAQPVSSGSNSRLPAAGKRGRVARTVAIVGALAVLLLGGLAVRGSLWSRPAAATASGAGTPAAAPSAAAPPPPLLATAAAETEARALPPASASFTTTIAVSALPTVSPSIPSASPIARPATPAPRPVGIPTKKFDEIGYEVHAAASQDHAAGAAPGASRQAPAIPAPAASVNCDPPTWTDDKGHVHLKQGCQ